MNDLTQVIPTIAVYALPVIFAITLHEAAHAYAAKYFGDTTAFAAGRMSLNPMRHIDPFGTILLPILLYTFTPFVFGYAKPVPIDFNRLRNPKKQMAWVALAGPAANFAMALGWLIMLILLQALGVHEAFPHKMAHAGFLVNVVMFVFNLVPIPPLDGGRILTSILPHRQAYRFASIEPYGLFIVIGLLYLHILDYWFMPMMAATEFALRLLASPLTFLLN
jgi:Zn-dependent protease